MNNSKKINDKGFSLIELIVVIAIMVVLVAILSPVFTRFIEQGRRATDLTNANTIASAILIDIESGDFKGTAATDNPADIDETAFKSIGSLPEIQGTGFTDYHFTYQFSSSKHTVDVYIEKTGGTPASVKLTDPDVAKNYKDQTGAFAD